MSGLNVGPPAVTPIAGSLNLQVVQGDTWQMRFRFRYADGTAVDLTSTEVKLTVRANVGDQVVLLAVSTLSGELTIDNGDSSVLNVNIPSSETLGLPVYGQFTKFCFDIVGRWNTSPEVINRLAYGTFQVAPAVTTNWS